MKKLVSFLLALLLTLPALFSLSACHGSARRSDFQIPESFDESRQYEITFWAKNDSNKNQVAIYEKAISDFEALYPNITVRMSRYTDYGKIYNDVITNIQTSTTPNLCITYPDHIATYITGSKVVVPLDDLLTDARYGLGGSEVKFEAPTALEIVPQFLDECRLNGFYYGLPYMRSTEACYINKTYVEKLGYEVPDVLTWDYIWEVSDAATAKDADGNYLLNGQKTMIPFIYKSTDNMMIQYLKQKGAGYSTEGGQILIFNDTTKDFLFEISDHVKKGAFSTFKISSYPGNFLNAGQCLFAIDSTAGATWMGSHAPLIDIPPDKLVEFETAVRMIPQADPDAPKMISQGPSLCLFNKEDPQEVMASWLFMQFLLTNGVQTAYSETEGYVPVTTKAQQSPEYQEYLALEGADDKEHYAVKIQAAKLLLDNTENTFVTPVFNGSVSLRDSAGQLIETTAKSTRRKETIDEAYMDKLFDDVTALYRLDLSVTEEGGSGGKKILGPLPAGAKALLISLAAIWVLIGAGALLSFLRKKKRAAAG